MTHERLIFDFIDFKIIKGAFASKRIRTHLHTPGSLRDKIFPLFIITVFLPNTVYNHTFKTILLIKRAKKATGWKHYFLSLSKGCAVSLKLTVFRFVFFRISILIQLIDYEILSSV